MQRVGVKLAGVRRKGRLADGVPEEEGHQRIGLAVDVRALRGDVVVLGSKGEGLVGDLVVVPGQVPRVLLRSGLEVGVEALGEPALVVLEGLNALGLGPLVALVPVRIRKRVVVLVDLVAQADDGVEVIARGNGAQRIEIPALVVHAAHGRGSPMPAFRQRAGQGQRLGPTRDGGAFHLALGHVHIETEAVVVPAVRLQPADVRLDAPIAGLLGLHGLGGHDVRKAGVRGHFDRPEGDEGQGLVHQAQPGPQDDRLVGGIARRHPVIEGVLRSLRVGLEKSGNGLCKGRDRDGQREDQSELGQSEGGDHGPNLPPLRGEISDFFLIKAQSASPRWRPASNRQGLLRVESSFSVNSRTAFRREGRGEVPEW